MVAIARKTHQNNMSFIMLAGRYTNIIASFYGYIYIVLVLLSPIYLVPMVLDSNMLSSSFHRVVPWTNLFLKGPDSMTHACPKLFYFFCVGQVTWAQHELNMHFFLADSLYITYLWRTWRVTGTNSMSRGPWHQPFRPKGDQLIISQGAKNMVACF